MFSSTAYEAFYTYIGLHLHAASIKILTSQKFFLALLLITFAICLFMTIWAFFSRYLPSIWIKSSSGTIGSVFKLVACLLIGMSLLRVKAPTQVKTLPVFLGTTMYT